MATPLKGLVQGRTVVLDEEIPPLEGKRVRVVLEAVDELEAASTSNVESWREWVANGPQGPIADEGEPEFP